MSTGGIQLAARTLLVVALASAPALHAAELRNLGRDVVRTGDTLAVRAPAASVEIDVAGWTVLPLDTTEVIGLRRLADDGAHVRVLDRSGTVLGETVVPDSWAPIVTDGGIVLVPDTPHSPFRPHLLRFLSFNGETRRDVAEAGLELVSVRVAPSGRIATVSTGPREPQQTFFAYDAAGNELVHLVVDSPGAGDAVVAANGERLVVLARDAELNTATIRIASPGRRRRTVRLPHVTELVPDPRGVRVAAVGPDVVAMLDGRTGKLLWQRARHIGNVVAGGVRFDRHGPGLIVVGAEIDRPAGKAHVTLRTFQLGTGAERRATLAETRPDALPHVVDVEPAPVGRRRVVLHDGVLTSDALEPVP